MVEDCGVDTKAIEREFGKCVASGVRALTKDSSIKKRSQIEHSFLSIVQQPREVWMVKLVDRITNLQPPPLEWSDAKIEEYMSETRTMLDTLGPAS